MYISSTSLSKYFANTIPTCIGTCFIYIPYIARLILVVYVQIFQIIIEPLYQ